MMHTSSLALAVTLGNQEAVMVGVLGAEIEMEERHELVAGLVRLVHDICSLEIEAFGVPGHRFGIIVGHVAKVTKFVDLGCTVVHSVEDT